MTTVVTNHNRTTYHPPAIDFYDNGSFYSEVEESSSVVLYDYFQILSQTQNPAFEVSFSDFDYKFQFVIDHFEWSLESNEISLFLNLDNQIVFKFVLEGLWTKDKEPSFQHKSSSWNLYRKEETSISNFLLSTIWAMLNLSEKVNINLPDFNYYFTSSFNLPLNKITAILQERQIAYRLMVIETALGVSLPFPNGEIKGNDIENIAYCYHSIVDSEFDWFSIPTNTLLVASQETLSWFPKTKKPTLLTFTPTFIFQSIFGIEIPLGFITAQIDKAVIDNYEEVKEKLAKLDNSMVEVKLRSLNGITRILVVDVPTLPPKPWDPQLQELIDLESKLDSIVLDKYFAIATSAFEGLTKEQKEAILERPNLDEDAFDF